MGRGKSQHSLDLIDACYTILEEIQPATVRAVCYRLFTMRLLPSMAKTCTNRVSTQLVYAREQAIIPWAWVVDETRDVEQQPSWDDADAYAEAVQQGYRRNHWAEQPRKVEVWSEKGTVRGTLAPVLREYGVPFRVTHGFTSATAINQAAEASLNDERPWYVFYVGDWDPSGMYMSEKDLPARINRYGGEIRLFRIALGREDVDAGDLPSFRVEAKARDTRYRWFREHYSERCWELDALSPVILRQRVEEFIQASIDWPRWEWSQRAEQAETESIRTVLGHWQALRISGQATK
jgi:hypothetical protein